MTRDNDSEDWILLNALVDGELEPADRAKIESRLASDPILRSELKRIRELKRDLASLRPNLVAPPVAQKKGKRGFYAGAMAACLCLVFAAFAIFAMQSVRHVPEGSVVALHEQMAGNTYVVEEHRVAQVISTGGAFEFNAPDLTASRLFLVDVKSARVNDREILGLHYRGLRGCRLTLVATEGKMDSIPVGQTRYLVRSWSFGDFHFAVIASGMDALRFAAVGEYAEAVTLRAVKRQEQIKTAMAKTANRSCA